MENITVTVSKEKLEEGLNSALEYVFKSQYSNPFIQAVEKQLKDSEGVFKEVFQSVLSEVMTSPDFKKNLGELAMQSLISQALKK